VVEDGVTHLVEPAVQDLDDLASSRSASVVKPRRSQNRMVASTRSPGSRGDASPRASSSPTTSLGTNRSKVARTRRRARISIA
jgi:hypothetical protein